MDIVILLAYLVSLAVFVALVACAISAALSLRRIASEAVKMRVALRLVAEIEAARGNNELASIQLANGVDNTYRLVSMPQTSPDARQRAANERAAKIDGILRA